MQDEIQHIIHSQCTIYAKGKTLTMAGHVERLNCDDQRQNAIA